MGKGAGLLAVVLAAAFGDVFGINIDGQLQVIKSDCFERLAIGQRLDSKDVYRTTEAKTVADCQKECTDDEEKCRSFSFGIGVKGNSSCDLSSHVVKETLDFKPIGTISDTDYDLYIKKLGCKLVLEKKPEVLASGYEVTEHPHLPIRPQSRPRPSYGAGRGGVHRVQSLVSVSQGSSSNFRPSGYHGVSQNHDAYDRANGSFNGNRNRPAYFGDDMPRPILDGPHNPYFSGKPPRPHYENPFFRPYGNRRPNEGGGGGLYGDGPNNIPGIYSSKFPHQKPIITETIAPNGQIITSIITEISDVCFRRALAGRRVARALVRRSLSCERIEDCQQECAEEKRFVCEGFNYRIDPTGRGRGDCELLEVPYIRLDISRDILHDPDCDYYTKDRNSFPDCKGHRPSYRPQGGGSYLPGNAVAPSYRPQGGGSYLPGNEVVPPYRPQGGGSGSYLPGNEAAPPLPPYGGGSGSRPSYYGSIRPISGDILPPYSGSRPSSYDGGGYTYNRPRPGYQDARPSYNRRNDYHPSYHSQDTYEDRYSFHSRDHHFGHHYPGIPYVTDSPDYKPPYDYKSYEPYLPSYHYNYNPYHAGGSRYDRDRERDRDYWGFKKYNRGWGSYGGVYGDFGRGSYGYQSWKDHGYDYGRYNGRIGGAKDWGKYGGSYGTGAGGGGSNNYDSWGLNRRDGYVRYGSTANDIPPPRRIGSYLPSPSPPPSDRDLLIPPSFGHNYVNDECSLRSVAGFRLYNAVVKKIFSVPSVYECELLCFKEVDFACNSYAYRYTSRVDNCYLSDKNYKELDYYTDIEQDRDCDVYTMHNRKQCGQPLIYGRDDCFLLARSGQRLDQSCVRDSLNVPSIVECQIECLKSIRFICRSFSYRYGPPPLAGVIDNCQLSDVPYYDLNPRTDLVTEPGFVLYERRSFGHGCELAHFPIPTPLKPPGTPKLDELCYIGYAYPAVLLPEATRKSLRVESEFECRRECTRCREETIFHCMSFSYRSTAPIGKPNCFLSDIYQRDLSEKIDYIRDPNSWLFAWDHYNPKCYPVAYNEYPGRNSVSREHEYNLTDFLYDNVYGLDTWKMYSVGGWPCKRGTCCRQDREIGFWFCELEGGSPSAWDYCCRPDHHCGYSRGYSYQWCYVGSSSTQWRKCNDRYYPYTYPGIDRDYRPIFSPYLPIDGLAESPPPYPPSYSQGDHREPRPWITRPEAPEVVNTLQPPYRPHSFRPDRPPAPPTVPPAKPSLDQYEVQFAQQFLDPPKPGGFGQPRYWPVSYLHKEKPPNTTVPKLERMQMSQESKLDAIQNLIDVIKSNDLKDIRYQITNRSDKADDVLFVQIPLPTNFTLEKNSTSDVHLSEPVDLLPPKVTSNVNQNNSITSSYRKGHVMKTSVANHGRRTAASTDDDFSIF